MTTVTTVSQAQLLAASRAAASASNCAGIALQAALSVGTSAFASGATGCQSSLARENSEIVNMAVQPYHGNKSVGSRLSI